jgi:2,5-diketo-D-gluconate reductase A
MTTSVITADGRSRVLADGNLMPMLGLGIWQVPNGAASVDAVRWALDLGYRHIDTAQAYGNGARCLTHADGGMSRPRPIVR